jgi:predicted component of type VI protein secretion system
MVALSSVCCAAAAGEDKANPLVLTLERIFTDEKFDTEDFQSIKQDDRITIESDGTLSIAADSECSGG